MQAKDASSTVKHRQVSGKTDTTQRWEQLAGGEGGAAVKGRALCKEWGRSEFGVLLPLCIGCYGQKCIGTWEVCLEQNFPLTYKIWVLGHGKVGNLHQKHAAAHLMDTFQTSRVKVLPFLELRAFLGMSGPLLSHLQE